MFFNQHVKVRKEKFGTVIFETLKEKVYTTNQTGGAILELIGEGENKEAIVRNLSASYEGDSARINDDVGRFINQLKQNELLVE